MSEEIGGFMVSFLYEWIRTLTYFFVLVTAVLQILPESGYRRYIRFFTGLVLICLLLTPVLHLFGQESPVLEFFQSREYEEKLKEIEQKAKEQSQAGADIMEKERMQTTEGAEITDIEQEGQEDGHDGEVEEIRIGR